MITPPFDRVVVDPGALDEAFTQSFLRRLPGTIAVTVLSPGEAPPKGCRTVHVTREPGSFIKPCPCSPGAVRCGYWVLTPALQCPFSCTYCFLRFYAPEEPLTLYANLEDAEVQFRDALRTWQGPVRLGTGEFADSLALDPWTLHSRWLRNLVAPHPRVILELKTKSAAIEGLLEAAPLRNLVVAWSLNPQGRIASDEPDTASLKERLAAAQQVVGAGYRVAFHFDPIVVEDGWESEYAEVVRTLFECVDPRHVAWVSLGTLRFPPRFLERWGRALRGRQAFFAEFLSGPDGKLRYFWPIRRDAYRYLAAELRRHGGPKLRLYLCMESKAMWALGLAWSPEDEDVEAYLTKSRCPALVAGAEASASLDGGPGSRDGATEFRP